MKIDVEVISKQFIKPSTPTSHHLRHYQFSLIDQIVPRHYIPFIYFYKVDDDHDQKHRGNISKHLKTSLSNVLTSYYPLAGRIMDNFVDCNDEGVLFLEAQVTCKLSETIQDLVSEFNKFLPHSNYNHGNQLQDTLLAIQVNFFECGSFAIGALISHKIADASSAITFIKNWAASSRGDGHDFSQEFVGAKLFPPMDVATNTMTMFPGEKIVLRNFVFSGSKIAALRTRLDTGIHPTRVEAVSCFISSRFLVSVGGGHGSSCILTHAVNLRKRMDQPLHDDSFGNITGVAVTISSKDHNKDLVKKFRDAIRNIDKDYVKKLQKGMFEFSNSQNEGGLRFGFTSFCRFPIYEADFGWGRPIWVAPGGWSCSNLVVLMDTKSGDGIEAWVYLKEEDMARFEADKEILAHVSSMKCSALLMA